MKIGSIFFLLLAGATAGFFWCLFAVEVSERPRREIPLALEREKGAPSPHIAPAARLGVGFCSGQAGPHCLSQSVADNEALIAHAPLPGGGLQVFVVQWDAGKDAGIGAVEPTRALAGRLRIAWQDSVDFTRREAGADVGRLRQDVYVLRPTAPGAVEMVTADDFVNLPQRAHAGFEPMPVGGATP